ncbi:MAG: NAD-binding protein [Acidimicrobiia bacterium]|nr:NAD-binding protein [Acidimicrobiia bacterium]
MIDPWRRTRLGLAALGAVLAAGTLAYRAIGLSWVDAYYQTLITVSTVGFTEVGGRVDNTYRLVTSFVVLIGVGVALYTIGVTMDGLMEGHYRGHLERTRTVRALKSLEGHTIICGWGQVGQSIGHSLVRRNRHIVIVDRREAIELDEEVRGVYFLSGDVTSDETMLQAGIERAKDLVVALDTDADTMYAIVTARALNPNLFIVARSNGADAGPKLRSAGANRVVNPHEIGGSRMASFLLHPNVAEFLGETMHDQDLELRLGEIEIPEGNGLVGQTLRQCHLGQETGVTVLAVRRASGEWLHHVTGDVVLRDNDILVALGTPEQQDAARSWSLTH